MQRLHRVSTPFQAALRPRVLAAVFLMIASGFAWAAAFTNYWYQIEAIGFSMRLGLQHSCDGSGSCTELSFDDNANCPRSGDAMTSRMRAVLGLAVVSAIVTMSATVCTPFFHMFPAVGIPRMVVVMAAVFAATVAAIAAVVYKVSLENWYFCGGTFCSEFSVEAPGCTCSLSYSFYFVVTTSVLSAVSSALTVCASGAVEGEEVEARASAGVASIDICPPTAADVVDVAVNCIGEPFFSSEKRACGTLDGACDASSEKTVLQNNDRTQSKLTGAVIVIPTADEARAAADNDGETLPARSDQSEILDGSSLVSDMAPIVVPEMEQKENSLEPNRSLTLDPSSCDAPSVAGTRVLQPNNTECDVGEDEEDIDDWVFDEASFYYFSASRGMYYDLDSGQFYDPESECWYDPATGEWVPA